MSANQLKHLHLKPTSLIVLLFVVAGVLGFAKLSSEVNLGNTQSFDERLVVSMRQDDLDKTIGPTWGLGVARDITGLGSVAILGLLTFATAGFLLLRRGYHLAILLVSSVSFGTFVCFTLKSFFDRPRPQIVPHLTAVASNSFPSGHAMMSAIVYLTLATIVAATMKSTTHKLYIFGLAFFVVGLIGFSRVFLGVHYPTDVIGGWMIGLVWAMTTWTLTKWLQSWRAVEQPAEVPDLES